MRRLKHKAKRNAKRSRAKLGRHGLAWRSLRRRYGIPHHYPGPDSLHRVLGVTRAELKEILVAERWP